MARSCFNRFRREYALATAGVNWKRSGVNAATPVDLDAMLTVEQAAKWLQMSVETLRAKSKGRRAIVPAFRLNSQLIRYHPRTILAVMAREAGVPLDLIAASMGMRGSEPA